MGTTSDQESGAGGVSRRQFLKRSLATAAVGAAAARLATGAFAQGQEVFRVGLIGCGGRGTGAAAQTLKADPATRLVAMGDAFANRLESSLGSLKGQDVADRVQVDADHQFVGLDSYQKVIDCGVDVVLLCEPPHFRPRSLTAAIAAGKHVFAEKPVAVDVPGVHKALAATEEAKKKNVTLVSGLCWRYEEGMRETIQRVHDGQIGDILAMQSTRHNTGVGKFAEHAEGMTSMQWQVRNWYYYTWLSGDFYVEQFVHDLDMMTWALGGDYPVRCTASGGRQVRTEPGYGNIYDHFAAIYEYANGVKLFADTRQWPGTDQNYTNSVVGTKGLVTHMMDYTIKGDNPWRRATGMSPMYQLEHNALYAGMRSGKIVNNGEYMAKSTLMGLMGRASAYTGKALTWEQIMNSKEDLSPPAYSWDQDVPEPPVAVPGVTQFS